jgi:hypothetical protein
MAKAPLQLPNSDEGGDSGASDDALQLTLGSSKAGSGPRFGTGSVAAERARGFKPTLRDNSPGKVPEGTSKIVVSPSEDQEETTLRSAVEGMPKTEHKHRPMQDGREDS